VELAAFALALAAWKYPGAGGYRPLPEFHLACSGLSVSVTRSEWEKLAGDDAKLRTAMVGLYEEFKHAPILGSLIDPMRTAVAKLVQWDGLADAVEKALQKDRGDEAREAGVTAQGLAKAAQILAGKYYWIFTNVPYLTRGKQSETLCGFCEKHYSEAKNDLATVFLDRCLELCAQSGTSSIVLPQNWLFLASYKKFREKLLKNDTWHLIARLGPKAFQTPMWDFNVQLITLSRGVLGMREGEKWRKDKLFASAFIHGLDVSEPRTAEEKATGLLTAEIKRVEQARQLKNPDAIVSIESIRSGKQLSNLALSVEGLSTGDKDRYLFYFWEADEYFSIWEKFQSSPQSTNIYDGLQLILRWENGDGALAGSKAARIQGNAAWTKNSVILGRIKNDTPSLGFGYKHDKMAAAIVPNNPDDRLAIWCYMASPDFKVELTKLTQRLDTATATLAKVPFNLDHWTQVAAEKYPNGLPRPYSDDPTQWIFHGHPCGSVVWDAEKKWTAHGPLRKDDTVLHVAVARLLGYRWPAELDASMELSDEQREWVSRCETLRPYADKDGIVCIPPVRGESSAADRLLNLLAAAFGDAWTGDTLARLLTSADHAGKSLETWLRDKFFTQHCKLFQHRPFIWHIWDGLHDGFAALVNYHKLDRKKLETLIYTYLGDWISRQKQDITAGIDGAQEKLDAALSLKKKLELILEGEAPYDIFVRWKPLDQQPVGWNPDLNDGVRLNIRPFMSVPDVGRRGAGALRDKPNIKWEKDRGKDVASAPWYHLFNGDRINDHHLTLEEKRVPREV